jgi:hypothetical protein
MTLYELFHSVPWSAVETALSGHYKSGESFTEKHQKVFERVLVMEPVTTPMVLFLNTYTEDGEDYVDLTGQDGTKNRDMDDFKYMGIPDNDPRADTLVSYALEFRPWQEWLGMAVSPETMEKFPPEEIIAHCLWEMTFIGFEEPEIQKQIEELEKTVEDIKSGKAPKGKSYSSVKEMMDDIKRRINEKGTDFEEDSRDDGLLNEEPGQG